ncbi:hypothetical protein C922_04342 [Plasmodium inui San Antonio 1]|uniref:Dynein heavy chain n=1 Tax=Plasmodium inui San Antonio 1 TaxID=1237626 RepID=W7A1I3_9APIC|nr:hypothetical protein C922_04342 [Plasmodium inui San Antonio 1]EUD65213.1 hypothetical protein C922_04342 [Plasmodium inui San Antonio 1]
MSAKNIEIKQNVFLSNIFCDSDNLKNLMRSSPKKRAREKDKEKNYLSAQNFCYDREDDEDIFKVEEIYDRDFSSKEKKCKLFVPFKNKREREPRFITIEKIKKKYKSINIYDALNDKVRLLDSEEANYKWKDILNYEDSSFDIFTIDEIVKELKEEEIPEDQIGEKSQKVEKNKSAKELNHENLNKKERNIVPFKAKGVISKQKNIFQSVFDDIYIYDYNYESNLFRVKKKTSNEFFEIHRMQFFFTSENPILYAEKIFNAIKNRSTSLKRKLYFAEIDNKFAHFNCILNDVHEIAENNSIIKNATDVQSIASNLNSFCNVWLGRRICSNEFFNFPKQLYRAKKEIKYYNYDFENKKNIIKQCVLLENKKVIRTFLGIINKCALIKISIFDTTISSPYEMNDFFQAQNASVLKSFERVNSSWMNDMKTIIEENLKNCTKGNYNLKDISTETFKYTKIRIFFNILKLIIERRINEMLISNMDEFVNMFVQNMISCKKNKNYMPIFVINVTKKFDYSRFILDNTPLSFFEKLEDLIYSTLIKYQQIEKIEKLVIPQVFKNDKFIFYKSIKESDQFICEKLLHIKHIFHESKNMIDNYLSKINKHADILNFNVNEAIRNIDINTSVEHIQNIIYKNLEKIQNINDTIEDNINLGIFLVKCKDIKLFIINEINNYIKALTNIIVQRYKEKYTSNLMFYNSIIVRLKKKTNKIQDIYEKEEYIKDMKKSLDFISHDIKEINVLFNCLNKLNYKFSNDDYLSYWKIVNRPSKIEKIVKEVNQHIVKQKNILLEELINDESKFQSSIVEMKENVQSIRSFNDESNYLSINKFILTVQNQLAVLIKESKEINYREKLFNIEISDFSILPKIQNELNLYYTFWIIYKSIKSMDERFDKKINSLNHKKIEDDFNLILKNMNKINKHANEYYKNKNGLIKKMNEKLTFFNSYVSLLISLRKPSIKERHKEQIAQIIDEKNNIDFNTITFNDLLKLNINNKITSIINICEKANKENAIEKFLGKIKNNFSKIEFQMKQEENNKIWIISNMNEILTKIEENLVMNQNLLIINIYEIYHIDIINNQNMMMNANNIIHTLKKSQNLFLYLSRIFVLTDISKQLANESKKYKLIYSNFLNLCKLIEEDKKLEKFCARKDTKEKLAELYSNLSLLLKSINEYLDLKREIFNRFYFLSTDDLINLISSNINDQINTYLFKIFNSIYKLVIVNGHIVAFQSQRGEELLLCNEIEIEKKEITEILVEVEKEMFFSVKKQIYDNILEYKNLMDIKEDDFLKSNNDIKSYSKCKSYDYNSGDSVSSFSSSGSMADEGEEPRDGGGAQNGTVTHNGRAAQNGGVPLDSPPGESPSSAILPSVNKKVLFSLNKNSQFVLIIKNLFWSNLVELFLKYNNLSKYKKILNEELYEYINIINKVDKKKSVLLHTLIISLVHNRDIVQELIKKRVNDVNNFNWLIQLKYFYYNKNLYIKYLNESYIYGYEYIHNDNKIILTSLINKYFISILHSYSSKLGVCSVGLAGTGKTETTKYFSKFVGKFYFVYNCSCNINFDFLKNLFFGIATNGIFFCFDEFNRISIEALSVLAQQLCNLFSAKSRKFTRSGIHRGGSFAQITHPGGSDVGRDTAEEVGEESPIEGHTGGCISQQRGPLGGGTHLTGNTHLSGKPHAAGRTHVSKKNMLFFEGKYIKINEEFNIFIIINPFYKGRSELPNNIKALFRFFHFIKPDFFTIVEVMLYSKGYKYSKVLSKKIILLFELCEHNLSPQKHYKYDLRTVKKITYVMGKIIVDKDNNNHNKNIFYEYKFLFIAIIECIMPSIVRNDIYIFLTIMKNIFYELYAYNQSLNPSGKTCGAIDLKCILSSKRNNDNSILMYLKSFYCNMMSDPGERGARDGRDGGENGNDAEKNDQAEQHHDGDKHQGKGEQPQIRDGSADNTKGDARDEWRDHTKNRQQGHSEMAAPTRTCKKDNRNSPKIGVEMLPDEGKGPAKEDNHQGSKLFLSKKEIVEDYLKKMLKKKMLELNYVGTDRYVSKLIQLYNMIKFHTGILFLSYPLSKTTSYKILSRTINTINDREIIKRKMNDYVINANVVREMDMLGFYEEVSNKWVHGILTKKIIEINSTFNRSDYLNIIYFDCYLHSLWIENLNSVLDESKILCLSKCDIIPIYDHTRFIMETYDLKDITMATVSRCGLIILNNYDLDIASYICSYVNSLTTNFDAIHKHILINLFIVFFYQSLLFISINNLFVYTFNEYYYCISFIKCIDSLFSYCSFEINDSSKNESYQKYITSIFVYSLIWSVGSNTYKRGRKIFNDFLCKQIVRHNLKLTFETLDGRLIDVRQFKESSGPDAAETIDRDSILATSISGVVKQQAEETPLISGAGNQEEETPLISANAEDVCSDYEGDCQSHSSDCASDFQSLSSDAPSDVDIYNDRNDPIERHYENVNSMYDYYLRTTRKCRNLFKSYDPRLGEGEHGWLSGKCYGNCSSDSNSSNDERYLKRRGGRRKKKYLNEHASGSLDDVLQSVSYYNDVYGLAGGCSGVKRSGVKRSGGRGGSDGQSGGRQNTKPDGRADNRPPSTSLHISHLDESPKGRTRTAKPRAEAELRINLFDFYFKYEKNVMSHLNNKENKFTLMDECLSNTDIMIKQKKHLSMLYNIDIFMKNKKSIIISGCSNIGKTLTVDYYLNKVMSKDKFFTVDFYFSYSTTSNHVRNYIESKLTRRRSNFYGTTNNRICVFYIDDINIETEVGSIQRSHYLSSHEFLRMLFNYKFFIDKNLGVKYVEDLTCLATMNNAYTNTTHSSRLYNNFNIIYYNNYNYKEIFDIFFCNLRNMFSIYDINIKSLARNLVEMQIDIYKEVKSMKQSYYLYNVEDREGKEIFLHSFNINNMRDIYKCVHYLSKNINLRKEQMLLYFLYENKALYEESFFSKDAKKKCNQIVKTNFRKYFPQEEYEKVASQYDNGLLFCNFLNLYQNVYEQVSDFNDLYNCVYGYISEYSNSEKINIILFDNVLIYICKITKTFMTENSHILCIGINDAVKRKVNKICAFIINKTLVVSELNKNSKASQFVEEIKRCLFDCGIYEKQCVYYLNDENSSFHFVLENLNNIYNYGDSYLLYNEDNLKKIYSECKNKCEEEHVVRNLTNIYSIYKKTIRKCFHVSLNISAGSSDAILKFPYILKNSRIIYFEEDNNEGLHVITKNFFTKGEGPTRSVEKSVKTIGDPTGVIDNAAKTIDAAANTIDNAAKTVDTAANTIDDPTSSIATASRAAPPRTLASIDLEVVNPHQDLKCLEGVVQDKVFIRIHKEVIHLAKKYQEEKQVHVCVNSNKYVHFLHYFDYFYNVKRKEFDINIDLYRKALNKLHKCEQDIKTMKNYLLNMQPVLNSTNIEMKKKVNEMERQSKEAYIKQTEIKKKECEMKTKIKNITHLKNEVNEEITKSFALLNESLNNLNKLKVEHLRELKAFVNPPSIVVMVMQCILTFLKEDEKYLQGKLIRPKTLNYWILAQKTIFRDSKVFLDNLKNYDKNLIEEEMITKISPLIKNKNFNPKFVRKASKACETMCQWILAIYHYFIINKELKPKKEEVMTLENEINKELTYLDACKEELNIVNNNLCTIEKEKEEITIKQKQLVDKIENIKQRIQRSKMILSCLLEQEIKWNKKKKNLKKKRDLLIGDCIIVSSLINYMSYFPYEYRKVIKLKVKEILRRHHIKHTKDISIYTFLESKINIEKWVSYGLTNSRFYFENIVIMNNSIKYNLLIDPHFIVTNFLKKMYHKNRDVEVLRNNSSNFVDKIERGMHLGNVILFTHYDDDSSVLFNALFNYKIAKTLLSFGRERAGTNTNQAARNRESVSDEDPPQGRGKASEKAATQQGVNASEKVAAQQGVNASEKAAASEGMDASDKAANSERVHTSDKATAPPVSGTLTQNNCVNFNNKIITVDSAFNIYFIVYGSTQFNDNTQNHLNVIDFNINLDILEEYFLTNLIDKLFRATNENRTALIHQIHDLNKQMVNQEEEILHILNYKEDILSDDDIVISFESANKIFLKNKKKMKEYKMNKLEIAKIRKNYMSMSEHISVIYHCINNLVTLNPMYNFSILSFVQLLNISIDKSEENKLLDKRKKDILNIFTRKIHYEISRTLSEKHQQIFFFYLVCMINIYKGEIEYDDYYFLVYDDYPKGDDIRNEVFRKVKSKRNDKPNVDKVLQNSTVVVVDSSSISKQPCDGGKGEELVTSDDEMDELSEEEDLQTVGDDVSIHSLESDGCDPQATEEGSSNSQAIATQRTRGDPNAEMNANHLVSVTLEEYLLLPKRSEKDDFLNSCEGNVLLQGGGTEEGRPTGGGVTGGGATDGCTSNGGEAQFTFNFETKNLSWLSAKEYLSVKKLIRKEKYFLFFKKAFNEYEHLFRSIKTDHTILQHKDLKHLLTDFEKLIIFKIFRFDILKLNMNNYVDACLKIGSQSYAKDLYKCYEHSSQNKLILILSENRLSTASEIMILNEKITGKNNLIIYNKNDKNYLLQILNDSIKNGFWVLIENAHLNIHLILEIEKYIEACNIQYSNPDFRIWISTSSVKSFPDYLLKLCVKITFENVHNLKSGLLNIYTNFAQEEEEEEEEDEAEEEEEEDEAEEEEGEDDEEDEANDEEDEADDEEAEDDEANRLPSDPHGGRLPRCGTPRKGVVDVGTKWGQGDNSEGPPSGGTEKRNKNLPRGGNERSEKRKQKSGQQRPQKRPQKRSENENILMNKLHFSLCFFHALIQERSKFKSKAFNNCYEFTDIDLKLSKENIIKFFRNKNIDINLLLYLIGNIIYGGTIIDVTDQRCFNIILNKYINEKVIYSNNEYKYNSYYYCPHSSNKNLFLRYVKSLNFITDFSIFNLHPSLNTLYLQNYNLKILKNLEKLEYNVTKDKSEMHIFSIIHVLTQLLPPFIDANKLNEFFVNNLNCSIITFLKMETDKYNNLLRTIYDDLTKIINFVKGRMNFTKICPTYNSLSNLCVPKRWIACSFFTNLQLFHYAKLISRKVSYLNRYIAHLDNRVFNLAAFMSPRSLMLAIRQKMCTEAKIDANNVKLKYEISPYFNEEDIKEDGYFVGGLFIEGAMFDATNMLIKESTRKYLYCPMPYIKVYFLTKSSPVAKPLSRPVKPAKTSNPSKPAADPTKGRVHRHHSSNFHIFKCPIYKNMHKTDNRLNNNEPIFYLKINSKERKEKWIERNVSGVLILK